MQWGPDNWRIIDRFGREWHFWIVRPEELASPAVRVSRWDLPEDPIDHLIFYAFDRSCVVAREAETAQDLVEIYDALMGTNLAPRLPDAARDPRDRLWGIEDELNRIFYAAFEAGVLKFERHEMPWPFPEKEEKPDKGKEGPREEKKLPNVEILLDVPKTASELCDSYLLESTDGSFSQTLGRSSAFRKDERTLVARFTDVEPGKTYHLFQLAGETKVSVFRNVPYGSLDNHGTDAPSPKPRPQPEARKEDPMPTAEDALVAWNDTDRNDDPGLLESNSGTAYA